MGIFSSHYSDQHQQIQAALVRLPCLEGLGFGMHRHCQFHLPPRLTPPSFCLPTTKMPLPLQSPLLPPSSTPAPACLSQHKLSVSRQSTQAPEPAQSTLELSQTCLMTCLKPSGAGTRSLCWLQWCSGLHPGLPFCFGQRGPS